MVDGEFAPLHDKIKAAIAHVSSEPIKYLVNTHFHGDHTGGNAPFAKDGAIVVAQDNVKKRLAAGHHQRPDRRQDAAGAARTRCRPRPIRLSYKIRLRGPRRRPHAHRQRAYRRRHLCLVQGRQRAVDRRHLHQRPLSQHRLRQWRQHQGHDRRDRRLSQARQRQDQDRARPRAARRQGALVAYRTMLVTARDRMAKLVKEGKSEDEVVAAKPFADLDAKWAPSEQRPGISSASSITRSPTSRSRSRC